MSETNIKGMDNAFGFGYAPEDLISRSTPADVYFPPFDPGNFAYSADFAEGSWTPPLSLEAVTVPPFPLHTLPGPAREYAAELSRATQTPPILAAGVSLGAASIALAKKIEVEPRPGWVEPVVLWILTLLPSGETVASAKIIAVSADTNLVADFAARMLHSQEETEGDPVVERLDTGRRQALRLITEEADTKDNGCTDEK